VALTKVTGQVINDSTGLVVGVTTVGGGLSATDGFFSGIVTAVGDASFSGNVSVGGTLTYEDVTNIDAVGLVTARNGIVVGSGITLSKDGDVFFTGIATGNGSGLTNLTAGNLTGALPAISGANLTNLTATNLTGTIPDARFPATLPAASAANLTNVPAANITGTLPALTAANLTNIPAANLVGVCTSGLTKTGGFGLVLKYESNVLTQTTSYGSSSTAYQEITNKNFVVAGTNSRILIDIELNGYVNSSGADRNFKLEYNVAGGSYTTINYNTVNTHGNNSNNMFGNIRGDSVLNGNMNVITHFLLDADWTAGQTLNFKLYTIGESTLVMNLAYSDGASVGTPSRFGRAISKISFTEFAS